MKKSKLLSVAFLIFNFQLSIFNCCYAQPLTSAKQYPQQIQCDSAWYPHQFITSAEAEKILQHSIFLKDSLCDFKNGYLRYNFTYKATTIDSSTKLRASLFFSLEQHEQAATAQRIYAHIKAENQQISNVSDLNGMGDEGFVAIDRQNNPFIMLRQNNRLYKLNTRHVTDAPISYNELMLIAKKIVAAH
jgi:hypothetical protein